MIFVFNGEGEKNKTKNKLIDDDYSVVELTFVVVVVLVVVVNDYVDHRLWKWRKKNKLERET